MVVYVFSYSKHSYISEVTFMVSVFSAAYTSCTVQQRKCVYADGIERIFVKGTLRESFVSLKIRPELNNLLENGYLKEVVDFKQRDCIKYL